MLLMSCYVHRRFYMKSYLVVLSQIKSMHTLATVAAQLPLLRSLNVVNNPAFPTNTPASRIAFLELLPYTPSSSFSLCLNRDEVLCWRSPCFALPCVD